MSSQTVLAIDVGGSSVKSALVEKGPHIVGDVCVHAIQSQASAAEIFNTLAVIIRSRVQDCREIKGIAFAFPGPFDYEQGICWMQNQGKFDSLYGLNVSDHLREILGMATLEIRYRNDAEAAILGEALFGVGASYSRLLGVTLGTGLGSAFIADGKVVLEGAGVPPHGWLYAMPYGTQVADEVFSTRGLLTRLKERGIYAADIASAIRVENEDQLNGVFDSFGTDLGIFLKPFASEFRAEAVIVTGGIAEAWDYFAPALRQAFSIPVLRGVLGQRSALLGAAALYFS